MRRDLRKNPLIRLAMATSFRPPGAMLAEIALIALLVGVLLVPLYLAIRQGMVHRGRWSLYWFGRVFANKVLVRELLNGAALGCVTTALATLLALPLAMLRARCRFRGQGVFSLLVLVPMILPPLVGALVMRHLISQFGVLNLWLRQIGVLDFSKSPPPDWLGSGFVGVAILQALHLFPILYLNISAALANVDPAYVQAARNLGASPWQAFWRITLPQIRPGLFAGGTIVFIWAMTDIGTPLIMGYDHVVPLRIFKELAAADVSPRTYSLVFLMLGASVTLYLLGKFLFARAAPAESAKASIAAETRRLGPLATAGAWLMFGVVIFLALVPHIGVVLTAVSSRWVNTVLPSEYTLRHLRFVLTQETTYNSILNSLRYAGASTAVDVALGCLIAWLLIRTRVFGRSVLDALAMLPLAVPGLILAAGYVALTAPGTWLEAIGPMRNPFWILVIAYSVRRLPFAVRGVSAGLQQVPESMEEAARTLGAGRVKTVLRITVPLIAANIIAAGVLTFAFAVLEVSDSLILAQLDEYYPVTKQIYRLAASGNPDAANQASALGVYGMALLGGTLALAAALMGKRLGAIFRA